MSRGDRVDGGRPYLIIGNPDNRRVGMFQAALADADRAPARVVSYLDIIRDPDIWDTVGDEPYLVRHDSFGEDWDVERELLRLGADDARDAGCEWIGAGEIDALEYDLGRILCPRQLHCGFLRVLERIERAYAEHPNWLPLSRPRAIARLFDKRESARVWGAAGLPNIPWLTGVDSPDALREAMRARGWPAVFVKLSCGSSASCVAIYTLSDGRGDPRGSALTTVERTDSARYNSLRLRRVRGDAVDDLLWFLLGEGAHIERAMRKAKLDGMAMDCRVVCVAFEPAFVVVRQSRHPITNLHLGGRRGDLDRLRALVPDHAWTAAMTTCRDVARRYGGLCVGIDLMFEPGFGNHRVIEANAFGDLLPGIERDGLSVYAWQIRAADRLLSRGD